VVTHVLLRFRKQKVMADEEKDPGTQGAGDIAKGKLNEAAGK
jgi:hypothetical protein